MISFPFDSVITGKDPETGLPILDRAQLSYQFQNFIASVFSSGIVPDITDCLKVDSTGGMRIRVAPGIAMCGGAIGIEPAERFVTIPPADPKLSTVYTVVCRKDNGKAKRSLDVVAHKGIPAVSPVPKELERTTDIDNQNSVYEICLAEITVPAGATSLSAATIRDTRHIDKLCGISSAYSQVKTTEIYEQFRVQFEEWFDKIKGQLSTDAAGNLQNQINLLDQSVKTHDSQIKELMQVRLFPSKGVTDDRYRVDQYRDGRMRICQKITGVVDFSEKWGNMYTGWLQGDDWGLGLSFFNDPFVTSVCNVGPAAAVFDQLDGVTRTNMGRYNLMRPVPGKQEITLIVTAIGRWG